MAVDLTKIVEDAKIRQAKERIESCLKALEQTMIDNQMTLDEVMACFQGLMNIYQKKAFRSYKIIKDDNS